MLKAFSGIRFLVGGEKDLARAARPPVLRVFDPRTVDFLSALSRAILKKKSAAEHPDVSAFAFFIRKANLLAMARQYQVLAKRSLGRGLAFHIAPSNVPVNFAYSLSAGLLSGNENIVRVSEKDFPQVKLLCDILNATIADTQHKWISDYVSVIQYGHSQELNDYISSLCDVRVIWGGDRTVSEIRKSQIPAKSFDVVFADRYSILILEAAAYNAAKDKYRLGEFFFNDTYFFDQAACSSPRLIIWNGASGEIQHAQGQFWSVLHQVVEDRKYQLPPSLAINKFRAICSAAIKLDHIGLISIQDRRIVRLALEDPRENLTEISCDGGIFFEAATRSLDQITELIDRKLQTITYFGIDPRKLRELLLNEGVSGVDRIVPLGTAGAFSFEWDGYDMIQSLSRMINVA